MSADEALREKLKALGRLGQSTTWTAHAVVARHNMPDGLKNDILEEEDDALAKALVDAFMEQTADKANQSK